MKLPHICYKTHEWRWCSVYLRAITWSCPRSLLPKSSIHANQNGKNFMPFFQTSQTHVIFRTWYRPCHDVQRQRQRIPWNVSGTKPWQNWPRTVVRRDGICKTTCLLEKEEFSQYRWCTCWYLWKLTKAFILCHRAYMSKSKRFWAGILTPNTIIPDPMP